jgi:hypothetical protein
MPDETVFSLDAEATDSELAAVNSTLRSLGFDQGVEFIVDEVGLLDGPTFEGWLLTISTPIVAGFLGALGGDGYGRVKQLVRGVHAARHGQPGAVRVEGLDHTQISLRSNLPDDAFRALKDLNWTELQGGLIEWSEVDRQWYRAGTRFSITPPDSEAQ